MKIEEVKSTANFCP